MSGSSSDPLRLLVDHYDALAGGGGESLLYRLREAFRLAGRDPDRLTRDEVASIDQLHLGGRRASRSLASLAGLERGSRVLDVGCGTGGASRLLASEFGADVTGVDITAAFVEVARWLSEATGLAGQTRFLCADAARLPLGEASFDAVWCQHALMNMPDVAGVLAEWRRLLVPGGRVLLHEIVAGENATPLLLPVPWARQEATSHLRRRQSLERALVDAGFLPLQVRDVSESALAWGRRHTRREKSADVEPPGGDPPPGLPGPSLIFGDDFGRMGRNLGENLAADRVRILEGVWQLA